MLANFSKSTRIFVDILLISIFYDENLLIFYKIGLNCIIIIDLNECIGLWVISLFHSSGMKCILFLHLQTGTTRNCFHKYKSYFMAFLFFPIFCAFLIVSMLRKRILPVGQRPAELWNDVKSYLLIGLVWGRRVTKLSNSSESWNLSSLLVSGCLEWQGHFELERLGNLYYLFTTLVSIFFLSLICFWLLNRKPKYSSQINIVLYIVFLLCILTLLYWLLALSPCFTCAIHIIILFKFVNINCTSPLWIVIRFWIRNKIIIGNFHFL